MSLEQDGSVGIQDKVYFAQEEEVDTYLLLLLSKLLKQTVPAMCTVYQKRKEMLSAIAIHLPLIPFLFFCTVSFVQFCTVEIPPLLEETLFKPYMYSNLHYLIIN